MKATPKYPLRIGILGCSDIARRKFIPALLGSDRAVLAAVAGRDREQARSFATGSSCRVTDYEGLVTDPAIDLIYISLPNHLHEAWTIRALHAGKHVICEKPLGLSLRSVETMLAVADDLGLLLYENLMFLHHPLHKVVKQYLAEGRIGTIAALRSVFGFPEPAPGNFRLDPARGGGAFHDLNRYPLGTAIHFLKGDTYRFQGLSLERTGLNLAMHGTALTSAEEVFSFSMAFGQQYESYYEIVGTKGKIRVDRAYTTPHDLANPVQLLRGESNSAFIVPPADHFTLTINHVAALISKRGDFGEEHSRALRLARLAEAMAKGCGHDT